MSRYNGDAEPMQIEEVQVEAARKLPSRLPGFQILLVDDNPADARLFEAALHEASARVRLYWVATGEEAIEYVNQRGRFQSVGPVSLVIMDLNLHGMTGFDLLKDLRAERSAKILPIVVLSSSRQTSDINRCYELGANSYIAKSMSFESFVGKVATVVRYWFDTVEQPNTGV